MKIFKIGKYDVPERIVIINQDCYFKNRVLHIISYVGRWITFTYDENICTNDYFTDTHIVSGYFKWITPEQYEKLKAFL